MPQAALRKYSGLSENFLKETPSKRRRAAIFIAARVLQLEIPHASAKAFSIAFSRVISCRIRP